MPNVSLIQCASYNPDAVETALRESLKPLGGIHAFVSSGDRVLLKPNLLAPTRPERAVTTHPAIVEGMVNLVQEAGGEPIITDSPGGPLHNRLGMKQLFQVTGMQAVAERTGVPLLDDPTAIQVATPEGTLIKRLDLLKVWQETDVTISLAKLKTHGLTGITGGMKNLFGLVPGLTKPGYHAKLPNVDRFCDMLLDIVAYIRPTLTVMDGILAMEGDGPGPRGDPRPLNVILASPDPVALDSVACQIIGIDPNVLPIFKAAARREWWPTEVDIAGVPISDVAVDDFALPASAKARPRHLQGTGPLSQVGAQLFVPRPVPKRGRCTACRTCERACPEDAIEIVDRLARIDYRHCIRCYCCHEICPEAAIDLELSLPGRILQRTGLLSRLR